MIIKAKAPLRIGLAGRRTEVSPYLDVFGGMGVPASCQSGLGSFL